MSLLDNQIRQLQKKNGDGYYRLKEDPRRLPLIQSFNRYLRDMGRIIIDLEKLAFDPNYRTVFYNCYFYRLLKEPKAFVSYREGFGWTTDVNQLFSHQIRAEKYFGVYYKYLVSKMENELCGYCASGGGNIHFICIHCGVPIWREWFEERREYFFKYNNQFRCKLCRELNFWDT